MSLIVRAASLAVCALLVVIGIAGCREESAKSARAAQSSDPPEVTVAYPVQKMIADSYFYTGRTEALDSVDIRARVTGFLDSINFKDGDEVEKDELLFVIDPRPYEADQAASKASLEQALAEQKLKTADANRSKQLREKGQVSQEEFERTVSQKEQADAQVDSAKANLAKADLNVTFCHVQAPLAGRISRKQFSVGNLINADTTTLTNIVAVDRIYVYFDVDEPTALRVQKQLREGDAKNFREEEVPLHLGLVTENDYPHEGRLDFVENQLNANTGTIRVRGIFDNPKPTSAHPQPKSDSRDPESNSPESSSGPPRMFAPGMFARIRLSLGKEYEALLIPERAIGTDQGQKFVYVVTKDENRVEYRRVTLGTVVDGMAVVRSGLEKDERIVINGLQRVRPKSIVKPVEELKKTGEPGA